MKYCQLVFSIIIFTFIWSAKSQVKANAGVDINLCFYDSLKVMGKGLSTGDTGSYQWTDLSNSQVYSNSQYLKIKISSLASKQYELLVTKNTFKGTFTGKDTLELTVNPVPTFVFHGLPSRCYVDGCIYLTNDNIAEAMPGNISNLHYFQKFKKPSWINGSSPYAYCHQKFIANSQVPSTGFRDTVCYDYTDGNGCYNYECKPLRIYPNPVVQVRDGLFCQKVGKIRLDQLVDLPSVKTGGNESYRIISVPKGSGVDPTKILSVNASSVPFKYYMDPGLESEYHKTGDYLVEYCFSNSSTGCKSCDTAKVTVLRLPKIKFDAMPPFCVNNPLISLDSFVRDSFTGNRLTAGSWECIAYGGSRDKSDSVVKNAINNSVKSQKNFDVSINPQGGSYSLKFTDLSSGCPTSDSIERMVYGLPQIIMPNPDTICTNSGLYQLSSKNYAINDTNGKWTGTYVTGNKFNSNAVVMGGAYSLAHKLVYTYTNPQTHCRDTNFFYKTTLNKPAFKIKYTLQPNTKYKVDFALIDSNMNLINFNWLWHFGNGDSSVQKYPKNIFYKDSGDYKAFLAINTGFCEGYDSITFKLSYVIEGISKITKLIKIYPNPADNEICIFAPIDGQLNLIDLEGKVLMGSEVEANQLNLFDISNIKAGIYFLSITNGEVQYWTKIIKVK